MEALGKQGQKIARLASLCDVTDKESVRKLQNLVGKHLRRDKFRKELEKSMNDIAALIEELKARAEPT